MSQSLQSDIDSAVVEARKDWAKMVEESGLSQSLFIAQRGKASEFLCQYEMIRQATIDEGYEMPQLVEGVTVNLNPES